MLAQTDVVTPDIEWSLLWPLIIFGVGGVLLVTITSLVPAARGKSFPAFYTAMCGLATLAVLPYLNGRLGPEGRQFTVLDGAMVVDAFTLFVTMVIAISVVLVSLLLDDYLRREGLDGPEWYVLMLVSASGGVLLASANDLIVSFLGLEILSIAVYVLAALHLRRSESQEAGFKYFILGALASAIFLYGIALVYGATGSTRIDVIGDSLASTNEIGLRPDQDSSLILAGMALILVGFGFKVSAVPFHLWTPDVYQGSPSPVVGFMASAVKVAAFAGLLRVALFAFGDMADDWRPLISAMAILTLLLGALLAIVQTNIKRMMAYSSISHAGFMLVGVYVAGIFEPDISLAGSRSVLFYMVSYTFMVVGTFGVITIMGRQGDGVHSIDSYRGLARRQPVLAAAFAVLLFGQAGIPFTSGFFAKFRVIVAAVDAGTVSAEGYVLGSIAMISSVIGVFLYLRVVVNMYMADAPVAHAIEAGGDTDAEAIDDEVESEAVDGADLPIVVPPAALVAVVTAAVVTVVLGVFPDIGADFLTDAAASLSLLR